MRYKALFIGALIAISPALKAETVEINGEVCEMHRLIERQIAPGVKYLRLQFPSMPLNVNLLITDLTNEYVSVENSPANNSARSTELITAAAKRLSTEGHKAVGGQNANFWAVSSQKPDGKVMMWQTRNASVSKGKMVTECNMHKEKPFGGPESVTGVLAITPDKRVHIDFCKPSVKLRINGSDRTYTVNQVNKCVHPNEIAIYNSFNKDNPFRPLKSDLTADGYYQLADNGDATEILCDLVEGQEWMGGRPVSFTVKQVRENWGKGSLGNHDMAIVARGLGKTKMAKVKVGDTVELTYDFLFSPADDPVSPEVETAIGGNLLMMRHGQVQPRCDAASYDSQTYARSFYGTSADGRTLYMMVVDKKTDPVYGASAGCSTRVGAQIARHFGCTEMLQLDGGGSAQMFVGDRIVNTTTDKNGPRNVANCMLVFDNSPESDLLDAIELDVPGKVIELACGESLTPAILLYNEYGSLKGERTEGFTLSCSEGLGQVDGLTFTASSEPVAGTITATYEGKSVTRQVSVGGAQVGITATVAPDERLSISPIPVSAGAPVNVGGSGLTALRIHTPAGQLVSSLNLPGTDRCTVAAPSQPGLYIVTGESLKGRSSGRILVE